MTDKINCPYCNYPIPKDEVICPVCDEIIDNYTSEVAEATNEGEKEKSSSSHLCTTNAGVVQILTGMFCLGIWLLVLFVTVDYQLEFDERPGSFVKSPTKYYGLFRYTYRQALSFLAVIIEAAFIFGPPFMFVKFKYGFRLFFKGSRVSSIIFYSVCMLSLLLFWYFYFGDCIFNDMNEYYYNKFFDERLFSQFANGSSQVPNEGIKTFTDDISTLADQYAKEKAAVYVNKLFLFYKTTYFLSTLFLFLPYIIYHAFGLDFDQTDTEHYSNFFNNLFIIPAFLVVMQYFLLTNVAFMFLVFIFFCTIIFITDSEDDIQYYFKT